MSATKETWKRLVRVVGRSPGCLCSVVLDDLFIFTSLEVLFLLDLGAQAAVALGINSRVVLVLAEMGRIICVIAGLCLKLEGIKGLSILLVLVDIHCIVVALLQG